MSAKFEATIQHVISLASIKKWEQEEASLALSVKMCLPTSLKLTHLHGMFLFLLFYFTFCSVILLIKHSVTQLVVSTLLGSVKTFKPTFPAEHTLLYILYFYCIIINSVQLIKANLY